MLPLRSSSHTLSRTLTMCTTQRPFCHMCLAKEKKQLTHVYERTDIARLLSRFHCEKLLAVGKRTSKYKHTKKNNAVSNTIGTRASHTHRVRNSFTSSSRRKRVLAKFRASRPAALSRYYNCNTARCSNSKKRIWNTPTTLGRMRNE